MANRKKTKEEKTLKSKQENVTSNIEEKIDWDNISKEMENAEKGPSVEDYENSELNKKAVESLKQELEADVELEELGHIQSDQEEVPDGAEQIADLEPKEEKPKLRILADDRLNSLINTANEMGITDVVQIINSDKFGQFYLVYKG